MFRFDWSLQPLHLHLHLHLHHLSTAAVHLIRLQVRGDEPDQILSASPTHSFRVVVYLLTVHSYCRSFQTSSQISLSQVSIHATICVLLTSPLDHQTCSFLNVTVYNLTLPNHHLKSTRSTLTIIHIWSSINLKISKKNYHPPNSSSLRQAHLL